MYFFKLHSSSRCFEEARRLVSLLSYLVKKSSAVRGVFRECRGPTHHGLVHAVAVIRHAHAPLVQVRLLLQQGAWSQKGGR